MSNLTPKQEALNNGATRYFTGKPCLRGHIAERSVSSGNCVQCQREHAKSEKGRATLRRLKSAPEARDKARAYSAGYHVENRDICIERMKDRNRAYYERNSARLIAKAGEYQRRNSEQRNAYKNNWIRERKLSDPQFAALTVMRKLVSRTCERIKVNRREIGRTIAVLGYRTEDFRVHIEARFKPGMTWANHGQWHVDHVRPLSSFDLTDPEQREKANALANLQPLWAAENMAKGAKWND